MKVFGVIFCCLMCVAVVWAMSGPQIGPVRPGHNGSLDLRWGPDPYGYMAKDTAEADGPDFAWIDISSTGTRVSGLGDDNLVGPFPIGFTFHYYWYDRSQFWIGSNGYIQFMPGGLLASPFAAFPSAIAPNDVIAPYCADWVLDATGAPGACYYETRGSDSLIVMWKNVKAWRPTTPAGNHNFEVILSRLDSSITFQYDTLTSGDLYTQSISIGWENVTGAVGDSIYHDVYPPQRTAIKISYPPTVTYVAHDMGIASVQDPINGGFFLVRGDTLFPEMRVQNVGNQIESGFTAIYSVRSLPNNTLLASDDSVCGTLNPAEILDLHFPMTWVGTPVGVYRVTGRVNLSTDINHTNDSVRVQLHVLSLPGELYYDDNTAENGWSWAGGHGGMANQFVPPLTPCLITQVRYFISTYTTGGVGFTAEIRRDSSGMPGSVLWTSAVTAPVSGDWNTVTVNPPVQIDAGAFFVGWMQSDSLITFGVDTTATQGSSRRSWEYSSTWAEYRNGQVWNPMIRCTIASAQPDRPPVITDHTPATLDTAIQNSTHQFSVTATDPDNDSLRYRWTRNGSQVGTQPSANILFPTLGAVVIKCVVSDGQLADSVTWNVTVVEPNAANLNPDLLPKTFALHAAYPNPFNPSTTLRYDIARDGDATLKIFDLLGNEVATLLNGHIAAGRYSINWNASALPSGTYFAVLKAGDVRVMQKLMLLK